MIKSPVEGYRQFIGKQYIRYVSSLPRDCQVILHMVCVKKNKQASEQYVYNDTICCKRGTVCLGLFLEGQSPETGNIDCLWKQDEVVRG